MMILKERQTNHNLNRRKLASEFNFITAHVLSESNDIIIRQLTVPHCTGGMSSTSGIPTTPAIQVHKQASSKI